LIVAGHRAALGFRLRAWVWVLALPDIAALFRPVYPAKYLLQQNPALPFDIYLMVLTEPF